MAESARARFPEGGTASSGSFQAQTPLQKAGVQIALGALYERRLADRTKAREAYEAAARLVSRVSGGDRECRQAPQD
ncbi:MAG: hypothetical protein HS122_12925 [Opitutaceae bacterium]|nr:hypothetical protein [Opitutaceae bacterium]